MKWVREREANIICECICMESGKMVLMSLVETALVDTVGEDEGRPD